MRYGESAISFYFHELLFPPFVPIPPSPSIRATFSIQPRRYPLDYRLLFLRAHPAQLVLRVRRANNLFLLPSRNDLSFSAFHVTRFSDSLSPLYPSSIQRAQLVLRVYATLVSSTLCACFVLLFSPSSFSVLGFVLSFQSLVLYPHTDHPPSTLLAVTDRSPSIPRLPPTHHI